jgi:hypothetical protein
MENLKTEACRNLLSSTDGSWGLEMSPEFTSDLEQSPPLSFRMYLATRRFVGYKMSAHGTTGTKLHNPW